MSERRRALLIAFHFPPIRGSSGFQRTLSFCRFLPEFGWETSVLTAHPRAYEGTDDGQLGDIPQRTTVVRAFALDSARHLAIGGSYLRATALPDRWISWILGAIPSGLRLIREARPAVLWSTYPIATAHLIGYVLHRLTGIPWIADFRDPMVEAFPRTGEVFPKDRLVRGSRLWVEGLVARWACRAVFCTDSARTICEERYPQVPSSHWRVIENGFDEVIFREVELTRAATARPPDAPIVLLHSGVLYASPDRDPTHFFDALRMLSAAGKVSPQRLQVVLRASANEALYDRLIRERGLGGIVRLEPHLPYRESLPEMLAADGLLLFQGYTSNPAIPAKMYEYLRARRPILALVDDEGETARLMRRTSAGPIVPIDDPARIAAGLVRFLDDVKHARITPLSDSELAAYSRRARAAELSRLLDEVLDEHSAAHESRAM